VTGERPIAEEKLIVRQGGAGRVSKFAARLELKHNLA